MGQAGPIFSILAPQCHNITEAALGRFRFFSSKHTRFGWWHRLGWSFEHDGLSCVNFRESIEKEKSHDF